MCVWYANAIFQEIVVNGKNGLFFFAPSFTEKKPKIAIGTYLDKPVFWRRLFMARVYKSMIVHVYTHLPYIVQWNRYERTS